MREFFKEVLYNLYIYCGNRQADKMSDEEIKTLLGSLERMSKLYNYIPEDKQKEIILNCLVSDREYQNINVRTVSKWLEQNGKQFFKEKAHEETEEFTPATEEQKAFWMDQWKKQLAKIEDNLYPDRKIGGGSRLREQIKDLPTEQVKEDPKLKRREATAFEEACGITDEMLNNDAALNQTASEGTGEATRLPENNSENPQPREDNNTN